MYAAFRSYRTEEAAEVAKRVNEGFIPIISKAPGFLAYYAIDTGQGVVASFSVFETRSQAEASNRIAADWVNENIAPLLDVPEITAGEIVVHTTA